MTETSFLILKAGAMIAVLGLVGTICLRDLESRRIPNSLVAAGLVVALGWHLIAPAGLGLFDRYTAGSIGIDGSLAGAGVAFTVFLILHLAGAMGAGDVKLMAFAGAVFGVGESFNLIMLVLLSGGAVALMRMVDPARRRKALANIQLIVAARVLANDGHAFDAKNDTADRLPYALAIGAAMLLLATAQYYDIAMPWSTR